MRILGNGKVDGAPSLVIGSVTTLAAGSAATITNTGNAYNAIFNFGIPRGAAGVNGTNGVDGKDGINGTNGVDGKDGRDGVDGKDAQSVNNVAYITAALLDNGDYQTIEQAMSAQGLTPIENTLYFLTKAGDGIDWALDVDFSGGDEINANGASALILDEDTNGCGVIEMVDSVLFNSNANGLVEITGAATTALENFTVETQFTRYDIGLAAEMGLQLPIISIVTPYAAGADPTPVISIVDNPANNELLFMSGSTTLSAVNYYSLIQTDTESYLKSFNAKVIITMDNATTLRCYVVDPSTGQALDYNEHTLSTTLSIPADYRVQVGNSYGDASGYGMGTDYTNVAVAFGYFKLAASNVYPDGVNGAVPSSEVPA